MKHGGFVIIVATLSTSGALASAGGFSSGVIPEAASYQELTQEAANRFRLNVVEIRSVLKVGPSETLYFKVNDELEVTDISSLSSSINSVNYNHIVEQVDNISVRSN